MCKLDFTFSTQQIISSCGQRIYCTCERRRRSILYREVHALAKLWRSANEASLFVLAKQRPCTAIDGHFPCIRILSQCDGGLLESLNVCFFLSRTVQYIALQVLSSADVLVKMRLLSITTVGLLSAQVLAAPALQTRELDDLQAKANANLLRQLDLEGTKRSKRDTVEQCTSANISIRREL